MKYVERSYAERAEREKRCKNRLLKVSGQNKCENFSFIDFLTLLRVTGQRTIERNSSGGARQSSLGKGGRAEETAKDQREGTE